ncbi:Tol-Pal system beta propeller repeat protein TolB [Candidatus Sumerlaeota bacterium]|nr:Tol-Pal system beta propeller repeat protein TolB [Candidatus Sumerlaeota bacterium]
MMKRRLLCVCILIFSFLFSLHAQETHEIVIKPKKYVATIAIPPFSCKPGSEEIKSTALPDVIYRDLELSGFFLRPQNDKFVTDTNRSDLTAGKIDFPEWNRLGCSFLLKGEYALNPSSITADCYLYDVKTGARIFGKNFGDYPKNAWRRLAHRISDEIVRYVTHNQGIACSQIIYISKLGKGKDLYIMDSDGAEQRALTNDQNLAAAPCWGIGGTEVYYTSYKEHNPDLWAMRLADNQTGVISSYPGFNLSPSWCEKTQRLVLTLSKDGNSEIYTMDNRGKNLKRLTYDRAIDSSPSWSPEGNQVVFTSDRSGSPQIYVMDSEGLNVKRLTFQGSYNDSPVWSPLGDRIAFASRKGGYFHIFLMDTNGANWIQLTEGSSNNEDPCWAPDGRHLAFTSNRTGSPQIYVINDDATILMQLTKNGKNQSPSWSPILY